MNPSPFASLRRQAYKARRSWETDEAYWFWTWRRWEWSAGLFKGFGFGVLAFRDEFALTIGCVAVSAIRGVKPDPREAFFGGWWYGK